MLVRTKGVQNKQVYRHALGIQNYGYNWNI